MKAPGRQVSTAGAVGMIFWRHNGKELFYLTPKWEVMAVDVTTTPKFQAGAPRLLFTLPEQTDGLPTYWKNISRDGQRFVFALDVPESAHALKFLFSSGVRTFVILSDGFHVRRYGRLLARQIF